MKTKIKSHSQTSNCLICNSETKELHDPQMKVTYDVCQRCDFILKQEEFFLDEETEKGRYDLHNNDSEGYKNSFDDVVNNYIKKLNPRRILDYGSGPYPVLTKILEQDYQVNHYDPFYHNDKGYLDHHYSLIVLSEVIEHMHQPLDELKHVLGLLEQNGYLIILTHLRHMKEDEFLNWWYRRDRTHVGFYSEKTFERIALDLELELKETNHKNIIVLQKLGD